MDATGTNHGRVRAMTALATMPVWIAAMVSMASHDASASTGVPKHAIPHHRASPSATAATPNEADDGKQTGNASYYSHRLTGRKTASGERYDPNALTAAHRTLPIGTKVRVVNPKNDKSVVVTVNDRGPVPKNRVMDVSSAAADALDMKKSGVTKVHTEVIGHADAAKQSDGVSADATKQP